MKYTTQQDQLAKIELLIKNDSVYRKYDIRMNLLDRLQLIEKIMDGRA